MTFSCLAGCAPHLLQRLLPPAKGPLGTSGRAQGLCPPRFSSGTSQPPSQMCLCGGVGRGYPKHKLSHDLRSRHRTLPRSASAAGPCLRRTRFSGPGESGRSSHTRRLSPRQGRGLGAVGREEGGGWPGGELAPAPGVGQGAPGIAVVCWWG